MTEILKYSTWTDIMDQYKYDQTGVATLYRNPQINPAFNSTTYDPTNHIYSLDPGENYIFDQKPIAFGFTAYIGHDELIVIENSLKSNKLFKRVYKTEAYFVNYSRKLYGFELVKKQYESSS
jgi:hypothetical protein